MLDSESESDGDYLLQLEGQPLDGGWITGPIAKKGAEGSGGHFSVCYTASRGDENAFLKVLDFRSVLKAPDRLRRIEKLTTDFNYERDLLDYCRGLSKVVVAIQHGQISHKSAPLETIYYILFELAEGDIRRQLETNSALDFAWSCGALHEISVGLKQIHGRQVFHQDLKPSNVLIKKGTGNILIADLGRAHCPALKSPNGQYQIPGLPIYAPPEQLYGFRLPDDDQGRMSADLYHLGSLIFFMFGGVMLTPVLMDSLRAEHLPRIISQTADAWSGTFEEVLPFLVSAFEDAVEQLRHHLETTLPQKATKKVIPGLIEFVRMLSHPDPRLRGDPKTRQKHANPFDLERIVSRLDVLRMEARVAKHRSDAEAA